MCVKNQYKSDRNLQKKPSVWHDSCYRCPQAGCCHAMDVNTDAVQMLLFSTHNDISPDVLCVVAAAIFTIISYSTVAFVIYLLL